MGIFRFAILGAGGIAEKPDCAYIAVTPNEHCRLSLLCISHKVSVLCEKAMFMNSREAVEVFDAARENGVFVMEALWSRFLPAIRKAQSWLLDRKVGMPEISQFSIGFVAPEEKDNRYVCHQRAASVSISFPIRICC